MPESLLVKGFTPCKVSFPNELKTIKKITNSLVPEEQGPLYEILPETASYSRTERLLTLYKIFAA